MRKLFFNIKNLFRNEFQSVFIRKIENRLETMKFKIQTKMKFWIVF